MTIAIYAGSFDPLTNGHIDILEQSAELFDKVIIAVAYNPEKRGFIPVKDRVELISQSIKKFKNVEVDTYEGLTVDFAKKKGASVLIRGVRNSKDFEYELSMAQTNQALNDKMKTVFFAPKPENSYISSSMVREILLNKGDISAFTPLAVSKYFKNF